MTEATAAAPSTANTALEAPASQAPAPGSTALTDGGQQQGQPAAAAAPAPADAATSAAGEPAANADANKTAASTAPVEYADFKVPEGVPSDKVNAEFKTLAKDLGLTQDQAQKLVDSSIRKAQETAKQQTDGMQKQLEARSAEWFKAAQTDAEYGGENLQANVALAQKAIGKFGTDAFKDLLQKTGLGNHPEVIRFCVRAGKAMSEDTFVNGAQSKSDTGGSAASVLYPSKS